METMEGRLRQKGTTLHSDASVEVRLQERPKQSSQSGGKAFQDLGNDFSGFTFSSQSRSGSQGTRRHPASSQSKAKPKPKPHISMSDKPLYISSTSSSEDELDFLSSQGSRSNTRSPFASKTTKGPGKGADGKETEGAFIDGVFHPYVDGYKPKTLPSFKKKKAEGETRFTSETKVATAPEEIPRASSSKQAMSLSPSPQPPRNISGAPAKRLPEDTLKVVAIPARTSTCPDVLRDKPNMKQAQTRNRSPKPTRQASRRSLSNDTDDDQSKTPRPSTTTRSRPQPRPTKRGAVVTRKETFPSLSPLTSSDKAKGKQPAGRSRIGATSDFPPLSPLASANVSEPKPSGKPKHPAATNPITTLSPLSKTAAKARSDAQGFPNMSPLSSPVNMNMDKVQPRNMKAQGRPQVSNMKKAIGRTVIVSEDDSDAPAPSGHRLAPFPMQTQLFESIGQSPPAKRTSEEDSGGESNGCTNRHRKKRREDPHEILAKILHSDEASDIDDDDLLFLDPNVDPSTLCPWCDERLPAVPTPHLSGLMDHARRVSVLDARPTNPLGLRAPLGAFVGVCQRHRFESHQIPRAQRMGWPLEIDWQAVEPRVAALREQLEEIVNDVDEEFLPGAQRSDDSRSEDEERYAGRPRKGSIFWRDAVDSVRKSGSRQAAGVRGQFASFDKTQPGYYGELGYVIINQTIYNLFPPTSFDSDATLPLTPTDFIQLILIPEAAVALIMEDLGQDRAASIKTLRDSAEYGVAMFPDDHAEGVGAVAAGDQIVMERARARRKELEEEERIEDELWGSLEPQWPPESSGASRRSTRASSRARAESETSEAERSAPTRSKRQTRARKTSPADAEARGDVIMVSDASSAGSQTRSRKIKVASKTIRPVPQKKPRSVATSSDADIVLTDDSDERPRSSAAAPRPRPRPRPLVRGGDSSRNASQATLREKENMQKSDDDNSDVEVLEPPPNQLAIRFMDLNKMSTPRVHRSGGSSEADATPRAKQTSRTSSASSAAATVGTDRKAFIPMKKARERSKAQVPNRADSAGWHYNMRHAHVGSTDDEDDTFAATPNRRGSFRAQESSSWLLSDTSTPTSSQEQL